MLKRLQNELQRRVESNTFRKLAVNDFAFDFYSNDYLGLGRFVAKDANHNESFLSGARLISGNSTSHVCLEDYLSQKSNKEALLFNSGYAANTGVVSTLPGKNDLILFDEHIHASFKDGFRLSLAKSFRFKHNDLDDLTNKIVRYSSDFENIFVVVESLYSMQGDFAPLNDLVKLSKKYNLLLVVDEAHATGIFGKNGLGCLEQQGLLNDVFLSILTFGKGMSAMGAAVLSNSLVKSYLINFSRPFIYTTASSPLIVNDVFNKFNFAKINVLQIELQKNIRYFRKKIGDSFNILSDETSPIQCLTFTNKTNLLRLEGTLQNKGYGVKAIVSPTVPDGQECLRLTFHATNTFEEINGLVEILIESLKK